MKWERQALALSETRLDDSRSYTELHITGSNALRKNRKATAVGVAVMIHIYYSLLPAERIYELESGHIEEICVEFNNSGCARASIILSCVCHPPSTGASFVDYLIKSTESTVLESKETHIIVNLII